MADLQGSSQLRHNTDDRVASTGGPSGRLPSEHDERKRLGAWDIAYYLVTLAAIMPMLVTIMTRWGSDYFPVHDMAVIDLRLRDVLTLDTPLVGAYSQFGWNHPGPILYWMRTPFMLLAGGSAWGMIVGSAVIHGGAVVSTGLVAKRSAGPLWAIAWTAVISLAYVPTGPWILLEAWNPHLAYPFFTLFLLLAWRCATVPGSYLPWLLLVGSVLIQLHVGYAPLVVVVGVWLAWIIWQAKRSDPDLDLRRPLVMSGWILAVLWLFPLIQALAHRGGNVRAVVGYFLLGRGREERAGVTMAGRLIASVFRLPPPWLGGASDMDRLTGNTSGATPLWLVVPLVLVALGVVLFRKSARQQRQLLALSWLMLGSGAVALALLRGKVAPYLFYWRNVVAILAVLAALAAILSLWSIARTTTARAVTALCGAILVVVPSARLSVDVTRAPQPVMQFEPVARALAGQIRKVDGPVIVRWVGSPLGGVQAGVVDELDRRGFPVGVDEGGGFQWGYQREISISAARQIWFVSERGYASAALERLPGATVIARTAPLTPQEDDELDLLLLKAIDQLRSSGHPELIAQLDSPLAYFNLAKVGVLSDSERQQFFDLTDKVAKSGSLRASVIAFDPSDAPTEEQLDYLR